jgi:pimeloyl-ACP methyl ester carboxylesterase
MSITEMIEDLESLRDHWGLPEMRLLGHSHGGDISLGYAIRYSGHVRKLILVDSGINDFDAKAIIAEQLKARMGDPRFMDAITALASDTPPKTDLEFSKRLRARMPLFFYDPDQFMERFEKDMTAWPSAWANRNFDVAEAQSTLAQDSLIDHVRASTLILVGRNDWVCPPIISERIHRAIVNSELKIFERTGHFPWIEEPREFFASISEFLGESAGSHLH